MNREFQRAMVESGQTAESSAGKIGVDPKTAARWVTHGRIPQTRHRSKFAELVGRDVMDLWPDVLKRREPVWLRGWIEWEREATALRWYELAWVPGLLQTEAYARATLAGESLTADETDRLVSSRIGRQAILQRDRPPLFVAVMDESVLHRHVNGNKALMREQVERIIACADLPAVQVHIVPAGVGRYPGSAGRSSSRTFPTACARRTSTVRSVRRSWTGPPTLLRLPDDGNASGEGPLGGAVPGPP
ncbi:DUF5753 domain-containing protein [Plantactinospora veratri]